MTYSVAVAGASGYAGGEVLRLVAGHPEFEVTTVTAHTHAGEPLVRHQPQLRSLSHLRLQETNRESLAGHDIVFLALPHGASAGISAELDETPLVVDCGADHRLTDPADWERFYGGQMAPPWVYGVPELPLARPVGPTGKQRDALVGARRIASPGCNASAVSLALAPGVRAGIVDEHDIVTVLAVGSSGAGKKTQVPYLASELFGTATPYAVGGGHRHIPEIRQNLTMAGATDPTVSFTPVLVPMARGILVTATARLRPGVEPRAVRRAWEETYAGEPFVHVLPEGVFPRTADVVGANTALIGVTVDEAVGRVVAVLALDNLAKGTAGAAVQCANIALGLPEETGLSVDGVAP
ncbi:MAG TPA: N-acetyl-gamma-glutamyl-phosphate reductase [Microbacteriaceae bacterium]|nr:N-acetyl-gamma-glutamyl-phosphate reductase [Microbacteriaceae bacterium]